MWKTEAGMDEAELASKKEDEAEQESKKEETVAEKKMTSWRSRKCRGGDDIT